MSSSNMTQLNAGNSRWLEFLPLYKQREVPYGAWSHDEEGMFSASVPMPRGHLDIPVRQQPRISNLSKICLLPAWGKNEVTKAWRTELRASQRLLSPAVWRSILLLPLQSMRLSAASKKQVKSPPQHSQMRRAEKHDFKRAQSVSTEI